MINVNWVETEQLTSQIQNVTRFHNTSKQIKTYLKNQINRCNLIQVKRLQFNSGQENMIMTKLAALLPSPSQNSKMLEQFKQMNYRNCI
jgi:hypothetical protein